MHSGGLHPTLQDEIHLEVNAMRMKPRRVLSGWLAHLDLAGVGPAFRTLHANNVSFELPACRRIDPEVAILKIRAQTVLELSVARLAHVEALSGGWAASELCEGDRVVHARSGDFERDEVVAALELVVRDAGGLEPAAPTGRLQIGLRP